MIAGDLLVQLGKNVMQKNESNGETELKSKYDLALNHMRSAIVSLGGADRLDLIYETQADQSHSYSNPDEAAKAAIRIASEIIVDLSRLVEVSGIVITKDDRGNIVGQWADDASLLFGEAGNE